MTARPQGANIEQVFQQPSLLGLGEPAIDETFAGLARIELDATSWLEHCPAWLAGEQTVFDQLVAQQDWHQRTVTMWDRRLPEPRLTSWWTPAAGPEPLPILGHIRDVLSHRYGEAFDSIGCNLYRDGQESVAWHGDRHRATVDDPVVAIVSVGEPRPFRLRPRPGRKRGATGAGGHSWSFALGHGDLLVMAGACQHDWEHCVPKVRAAGPRLSITYRHGAR